jgi:mono/diheme cytochrome c family protein
MTVRPLHLRRALARGAALIVAAALGLPVQAAETAQAAGAASSIEKGHQVFSKWCAPCHAPNPRLAGTLALQTKYAGALPAALEQRTDLTPEIVSTFVRHGVAWMAPFRKTEISDAELADLGAYLSRPRKEGAP